MSFRSLNQQIPDNGSGTKLYKGIVVDNNDPLHLDRVKAVVPELYDNELGEIPWIIPIKQSMFGQGKGFGHFGAPPIGSVVVIGLQSNDANFPFYYGYFLTTANTNQDYVPGVYGLIDQSGSKLTVDCNKNVLTYAHISGVTVMMSEGTLTINCSKDIVVNVTNATVNASNATVKADTVTNECSSFIVKASDIQLQGPTKTGPLSTPYGGGGADITGGIKNTGGTISSNGIVLDSHTHGGVEPGGSNTSGPQ